MVSQIVGGQHDCVAPVASVVEVDMSAEMRVVDNEIPSLPLNCGVAVVIVIGDYSAWTSPSCHFLVWRFAVDVYLVSWLEVQ